MNFRKLLGVSALSLAVAMVGCGDDDNGPVNGDDADVPPPPPDGFEDLPQLRKSDGETDANYACLGDRTAPEGNEDSTFTLEVRDFRTGAAVPGVCVNFYPDNVVPVQDECGGTMTDEDGNIEGLTDPDGGWFAYRIFPTDTTLGVVQVNVDTPADGGSATGNSVDDTTANLIPGLVGRSLAEGRAIFSGALYDCDNSTVEGGAFRVVRDGAVIPEGPGSQDTMYAYFGPDLPDPQQEYTNTNGLYLGLNVPVQTPGETVQLVACGKPDGENLEVLGCEETISFPDTVNILSLYPTRSDGPNCPDICND
jgi:hypothetical protein